MSRFVTGIVIAFVLCSVEYTTGYKWITLKSNDTIPKDAIKLSNRTYVGRAVHYNLVLPAEVYNSSLAIVSHNNQQIAKKVFEVLTETERCEWEELSYTQDVSPNVLLGGSAWNNEPIYIAKTTYVNDSGTHIASILLESNKVITWDVYWYRYALLCDVNTTWIETSSANLPKNAVSCGNSSEYFVGRLLGPSSWLPGVINPALNITYANFGGFTIESLYTQALVGDTNQYKWYTIHYGLIPDYAVVGGQAESGEMRYIVKKGVSSGYALASELRQSYASEILVQNV